MNAFSRGLCWFCGKTNAVHHGHCIGGIAYNSEIHISDELAIGPSLGEWTDEHRAASNDTCNICTGCIHEFNKRMSIDDDYASQQKAFFELQQFETADIDTYLLPWQEARYPIDCCVGGYPKNGVRQRFGSLSMGQLYSFGWRLHGKIRLCEFASRNYLERFVRSGAVGCAGDEFVAHIKNHIISDYDRFYSEFYFCCGIIHDITIRDLCVNPSLL